MGSRKPRPAHLKPKVQGEDEVHVSMQLDHDTGVMTLTMVGQIKDVESCLSEETAKKLTEALRAKYNRIVE